MILVTGGAGFIGSHLVRRLLKDQCGPVTVLDDLSRAVCPNVLDDNRVRFIRGNITDVAVVDRAMRDAKVVFHLAAKSNVIGACANVLGSFDVNVTGTLRILESALQHAVRRVAFTSSREVYGEPDQLPVPETAPIRPKNAYGASKACAEMYTRIYAQMGLDVAVLRLSNVYGAGDRDRVLPIFIHNALTSRPLLLFGGQQVIDFVAVDQVVEALVRSGFGPAIDGPVNIGSGQGITVAELSERVVFLTGSKSSVEILESRDVEVSAFVADTTYARSVLQIEPPRDSLQGLGALIEWTARQQNSKSLAMVAGHNTGGRI